ncbi:F-box protein CPR1-like [Andrographis paniculata]|uniref:F-box protein CPR1-like n=1 Tax=Andrographis paniculata TaxID=175694 RepID=UPI0021E7B0C8|nr:F-box protein CPR1-like [Andrographis paniculata]
MEILPFELIEDILRRLPVKSLKRFCAVAKSWFLLIESENFRKLHLRQSLLSNSNRSLLLGGLGLYNIKLDAMDKAEVMKPPFYYKSVDWISNSCHGIVLVMSDPPVLWNPFSTDYRVLPDCAVEYETPAEAYPKTAYGFGYDSSNDDYKVVRIVEVRHKFSHVWIASEAKVYSLKSNSWRRIEDFPYPLPFLKGNWRVHVRGSMHTLVEDPNNEDEIRIMCFNVQTEKHYQMMLPQGVRTDGFDVTLDVLDGNLSMVCTKRQRIVIWVMNDYGVKESWFKLLSVSTPAIERNDIVKPLVYSKDGKMVLLNCDDKRLIWYDLRTKAIEEVIVEGMPFVFYAESCVETLISLNNKQEIKKQIPVRKKEKIRNKRDDFLSEGFKLVL